MYRTYATLVTPDGRQIQTLAAISVVGDSRTRNKWFEGTLELMYFEEWRTLSIDGGYQILSEDGFPPVIQNVSIDRLEVRKRRAMNLGTGKMVIAEQTIEVGIYAEDAGG